MRSLRERGLFIVANRGKVIRFSRADRVVVEAHTWTAHEIKPGQWYAHTTVREDGVRRQVYLHQMLGFGGGDHISGDGLDNRRENLRRATKSQQLANQRKRRLQRLTSRYKGVSWCHGRWQVMCGPHTAGRYLGRFSDEEAAARAYDRRALELWGEYARTNFP